MKSFLHLQDDDSFRDNDYNAKHIKWELRIVTLKGRKLLKTFKNLKLSLIAIGEPTYWPSDTRKTPDFIDFLIVKDIGSTYFS